MFYGIYYGTTSETTKAFEDACASQLLILWGCFLLTLTSRKAEQTQYIPHTFIRIATILYYISLNWKHCSFNSYTILLPQHIFQKNAFGLTLISIPLLPYSELVLDAECFTSAGLIHPRAWTSLTHCRESKHTQDTHTVYTWNTHYSSFSYIAIFLHETKLATRTTTQPGKNKISVIKQANIWFWDFW